jgi:hypothetical protein
MSLNILIREFWHQLSYIDLALLGLSFLHCNNFALKTKAFKGPVSRNFVGTVLAG